MCEVHEHEASWNIQSNVHAAAFRFHLTGFEFELI